MGATIKLGGTGTYYEVSAPQYGYSTEIRSAFRFQRVKPKGYIFWDDTSANDSRICKCEFIVDATDYGEIMGLLADSANGRGKSLNLHLPRGCGFYPFGPDKGDYGKYPVDVVGFSTKILRSPMRWGKVAVALVAKSYPSYSLPAERTQGNLQIGSITGLRYPDTLPDVRVDYAISTRLTESGVAYTVDGLEDSDNYDTTLSMVCNQSKAAALINHLVTSVRYSNTSLIGGANTYLFGLDKIGNGTYTCKWLDNVLKVNHEYFDRFTFDLNFNLVSIE